MNSMRAAILSNPTLAEVIHQNQRKREEAQQRREARKALRRALIERDAAIMALLKARKSKKKSRPIFARVMQAVENLRETFQSTKSTT